MEIASRIQEILNTFTEDSQALIFAKCDEYKFDPDKGDITLTESFINLNQAKIIILDAIEKSKLTQLPLSIQKAVLSMLERIQTFQTNIVGGADDLVNLVNGIESLYSTTWTNGFHNLSTELLGFATKMNQLKEQELKATQLQKELQKGIQLRDELQSLHAQIVKSSEGIKTYEQNAKESLDVIIENSGESLRISQEAGAHLATSTNNDTAIAQFLASSKTSSAAIGSLETKIKEFYDVIDTSKEEVERVKGLATKTVTDNNDDTDKLIKKLSDLEDGIKDEITRATGTTLFHSFQKRKEALETSKRNWVIGLFLLVGLSIGLTFIVAETTTKLDEIAFFIKLSISLPLIYAIAFCSIQYTRERKLEEEYAFKSNISISLGPYKDLVEKLVGDNPEEKAKFTSFIIDSIAKVFTSPTRRIFEKEKSDIKPSEILKEASEMIKPFVDTFKK